VESSSFWSLTPPTHSGYRADIDGLRAVAVLSVIGFHYKLVGFSGGYVGVDVFFVISGFLIGSIIYRELSQNRFSIQKFYERRFRRILPALLAVVAFTLVVGSVALSPYELRRLAESAVAACLSLSNFLFIVRTDYFAGGAQSNPLLMTWSLAVEEQFYLFCPLLMLLMRRKKKSFVLMVLGVLIVLSLLSSIYAEFYAQRINFYFPITRGWSLGIGVFLAVWISDSSSNVFARRTLIKELAGVLGIGLLLFSISMYTATTRFPGYETIPPVLGSALLILSQGSVVNRVLAWRPLVIMGLVSYSLYLWHWPLLAMTNIICVQPIQVRTSLILLGLTVFLAFLSYFTVEKPFRSVKLNTKSVLWTYGGATLAVTLVAAIIVLSNGAAMRYPQVAKIETNARLFEKHICLSSGELLTLSRFCVPEAKDGVTAVALLGDSHADSIARMLRGFAASQGKSFVELTHEKCPATMGWTRLTDVQIDPCRHYNRRALEYVVSRPDIKTVFLTASWSGPYIPNSLTTVSEEEKPNYYNNIFLGLQEEVKALQAAGKNVVIMEDIPVLKFDPMWYARYELIPARRVINRFLAADEPNEVSSESVSRQIIEAQDIEIARKNIEKLPALFPNVTVLDPTKFLCDSQSCFFADREGTFYSDSSHLNDRGSAKLLPMISTVQF
jgi:peptidoglycan/LPS O-acetylase OafA/YrhL